MNRPGTNRAAVDGATMRAVAGRFCSGITVVTSCTETGPAGLTCQAFFSVSLEPPLIAVCVSQTSTSLPFIRAAKGFTINILGRSQAALSTRFARSGCEKWAGVSWRPSPVLGHPILGGVMAWLECETESEQLAGDHVLIVGRVLDLQNMADEQPLLYFKGRYGSVVHDL